MAGDGGGRPGTRLATPGAEPELEVALTQIHILVVDDDPSILEVMARALSEAEYRVSTVRRVALARDVLCRQPVDLVITDARIPGETGLELAEKARELGIPVIIMTGDPEWAESHGLAPDAYLAKPFELRHLIDLVRSSVDARPH